MSRMEAQTRDRNKTASSTSEIWKAVGNIDCVVGVQRRRKRNTSGVMVSPKDSNPATTTEQFDILEGTACCPRLLAFVVLNKLKCILACTAT